MCGRLYLSPDDNGQLALEMLTSCAKNSWCSMLRQGATATMEAWTTDEKLNLSWSHPWASAPASAVVWGLFGIRATTPGWGSVVVKPQPGNLSWATIRVPSLRGPVEAAFNQTRCSFRLVLRVPDEVQATACLPRLGCQRPFGSSIGICAENQCFRFFSGRSLSFPSDLDLGCTLSSCASWTSRLCPRDAET